MRGRGLSRRTAIGTLLAGSALAAAPPTQHRIAWLAFGASASSSVEKALIDALAERHLRVGQDLLVEFRYAEGRPELLEPLARELVASQPKLLVGIGGDIVSAIRSVTTDLPIVGGVSDDPVRAGIAESLARPGKNFTGVTFITDQLAAKRVQILREVFPAARHVGVIWNPQHLDDELRYAREAAEALELRLTDYRLDDIPAVDGVLESAVSHGIDCLLVIPSRLTGLVGARIAKYGEARQWPVVAAWREFAQAGCLLSYGPNRAFESRQIAALIERVLKGAKPGDLPIEQPSKFELVVNLKTAKAIGVDIPDLILTRADEVIE